MKVTPGPVYSQDGIPYDYIVIVDSGSKGSRVFVYNWLNPYHALTKGFDLSWNVNLVRRFDDDKAVDDHETTPASNQDSSFESQHQMSPKSANEFDQETNGVPLKHRVGLKEFLRARANAGPTPANSREPKLSDNNTENNDSDDESIDGQSDVESEDSDSDGELTDFSGKLFGSTNRTLDQSNVNVKLPRIFLKKHWHKKIKPGISSFHASPRKIGRLHIKHLLSLAANVVPKSQHARTPIFLHSTAGMRLLTPTEQNAILDNICTYLQQKSDFYVPDCDSHVNVIDGSVEGLYGWLSINYMKQSLDHPEDHMHGKNHTTYGLLDMGGASTQVVFLPNSTEIDEHPNNLFKINLNRVPNLHNETGYAAPEDLSLDVYSDSFLGFGMYQARNRYLTSLVDSRNVNDKNKFHSPIVDPCLPKGFTFKEKINDFAVDFVGGSNFEQCLEVIFPVLSNSTHNGGNVPPKSNCKQLSEGNEVSSCLLNDLIPAFDFDVNHFIGVSGYWDSIQSLLSYDKAPRSVGNDSLSTYDYQLMYNATKRLCSQSFNHLMDLNNEKSKSNRMDEDDLAELCFKSSWILNFLHIGLGFPRFGIDELPNKSDDFVSLQLVEELGGSPFTWTLGRALLYANDEYVQAYNNYSQSLPGEEKKPIKRPGFYHSASKSVYHFGAEQNGVYPRPQFVAPRGDEKYPSFDYENAPSLESSILKWEIEPHRWAGFTIFMLLMGFIVWLMFGSSKRVWFSRTKEKFIFVTDKLWNKFGANRGVRYNQVPTGDTVDDLEPGFELNNMPSVEHFKIDSDDETV